MYQVDAILNCTVKEILCAVLLVIYTISYCVFFGSKVLGLFCPILYVLWYRNFMKYSFCDDILDHLFFIDMKPNPISDTMMKLFQVPLNREHFTRKVLQFLN